MIALIGLAGILGALRQADQRVATIAWRLQTVNVAACAETAQLPGFTIETLDQYAPGERAEAAAQFGLGDLPQVSAIVPGSGADKGGLRVGDVIRAVDGMPLAQAASKGARYDQTAAAESALADALAHPPVVLTLADRTLRFTGDKGCVSRVQLVPGHPFDSSADGRYVQISGALYDALRDDNELAFVVAHEIAHNAVPEAKRASSAAGQRAAELAADRAAIVMMAHAGYDVAAVVPLMERFRRKLLLAWPDANHPGWTMRIAAARAAAAAATQPASPGDPG